MDYIVGFLRYKHDSKNKNDQQTFIISNLIIFLARARSFHQATGNYRVEDPKKTTGSKTHGRSVLKTTAKGLGADFLFLMGLEADFLISDGSWNLFLKYSVKEAKLRNLYKDQRERGLPNTEKKRTN